MNNIPKIDLHCHLDGSLTPEFLKQTLNLDENVNEIMSKVSAPVDCDSLTTYLKCFDLPIKALQTKENITSSVLSLLKDAANDGLSYIEIRFAPTFSLAEGLSYKDVCEAAISGRNKGLKRYGIHSNIILCAMRNLDMDTNMEVLRYVHEYLDEGICALDIAGDESHYANELFVPLFEKAHANNIPFTIHSGECGRVENVRIAYELGAARIGHGIALAKDSKLMQDIITANVCLELCPTSNVQTKAVADFASHPLRFFLDNGVNISINTDNRTVSRTTSSNELLICENEFRLTYEEEVKIYKDSVCASFADDNTKNYLLSLI